MIDDLKNKVVLITGASTGIGAAAAIAFARNGAKVAVHYNQSKAEAEKVAAQVEKAGGKALLSAATSLIRQFAGSWSKRPLPAWAASTS